MKQVDFYLISNRVTAAKLKLASRLSNKIQRLQQRALVVTESDMETDQLDSVMWSFSDTSFLAHDRCNESAPIAPVQIGATSTIDQSVIERDFQVMINLTETVPEFAHQFSRIAEIVESDEPSKAAARQRYKQYQHEGFELRMHNIEL